MRLLIDTGASMVGLDRNAIRPLGLAPTGVAAVHTPSTAAAAPHSTNQYDVSLIVPPHVGPPLVLGAIPVLEGDFGHQRIDGLLGRDVLSLCTLIYNAPAGGFTLAY
jgi:hypothetical protein